MQQSYINIKLHAIFRLPAVLIVVTEKNIGKNCSGIDIEIVHTRN